MKFLIPNLTVLSECPFFLQQCAPDYLNVTGQSCLLYVFYTYTNCKTSVCQVPLDLHPDFTNRFLVTSASCSPFPPSSVTQLLNTAVDYKGYLNQALVYSKSLVYSLDARFVCISLFPQAYFSSGIPHPCFFLRLNTFHYSDSSTTPQSENCGHGTEISSPDESNSLRLGGSCVPSKTKHS